MLFNSINFLVFFPVVVFIYFMIPKKCRYLWLLAASYYFYMCWNAKYVILIFSSTLVTWIAGWLVSVCKTHRKWMLGGSLLFNLGLLFFFKYFDFFWEAWGKVFSMVGGRLPDKPFDVLLPVGISFYTFQALGYMLDVYRGKIEPEKNFFRYALFVSFFPQLVAGPIERSDRLLRQIHFIERIDVWNYDNIAHGLMQMVWGLFQKMVIADRVAVIVDTVFGNYYIYGTVPLVIGAVGFALQVYCDFASYSSIAIGAAKVMGFDLMENFDTPYFARSISEFWRRWHISLSSWFRDYVYIPLGGEPLLPFEKIFESVSHICGQRLLAWGGLDVSGMGHAARDISDCGRFDERMQAEGQCVPPYEDGKLQLQSGADGDYLCPGGRGMDFLPRGRDQGVVGLLRAHGHQMGSLVAL